MHCRRCNGAFEDTKIANRTFILATVYIVTDRHFLLWVNAFGCEFFVLIRVHLKCQLQDLNQNCGPPDRIHTYPSLFHSIFHWDASSISIWSCRRRLHLTDELTLLSLPLDDRENHEPTHFFQHIAFSRKKKKQKGDLHQTLESGNPFRPFTYPWLCSCLDCD